MVTGLVHLPTIATLATHDSQSLKMMITASCTPISDERLTANDIVSHGNERENNGPLVQVNSVGCRREARIFVTCVQLVT